MCSLTPPYGTANYVHDRNSAFGGCQRTRSRARRGTSDQIRRYLATPCEATARTDGLGISGCIRTDRHQRIRHFANSAPVAQKARNATIVNASVAQKTRNNVRQKKVPREGFEPPTLCLEDRCSIH